MNLTDTFPIKEARSIHLNDTVTFDSEDYTFVYAVSGSVHISGLTVSFDCHPGDIFLLNPEQSCQASCSDGMVIRFGIHRIFVHDALGIFRTSDCNSVLNQQDSFLRIKQLVLDLYADCSRDYDTDTLSLYSNLLALLHELSCFHSDVIMKDRKDMQDHKLSDLAQQRITSIISYMEEHYTEHLTLPQLAESLYLTPQYLSAFFSRHFGMTFHQYLTQIRLKHVQDALRYSDAPLAEIAVNTGFSNANILYKNFCKAYGISPSAYRKNLTESPFPQKTDALSSDIIWHDPHAAAAYPQQYTFSALGTDTMFHHHYKMINIGSASNLLSEKYRRLFLSACKTFQFQYVRLQEVVSNAFIPRIMPHYQYSYQKCDRIFTFLYDQHLLPVIELSRLPLDYSYTAIKNKELYSVSHGNRFLHLLEDFIIHCIHKWPLDWLSQWKFEFWLSPHTSVEKYCEEVRLASQIIHSYIPQAQIGGPGYSESIHPVSPEQLLTALKNQNVSFDFFSLNLNLFCQKNGQLQFTADASRYRNLCIQINDFLKKYRNGIPLYITEWTSANIPLPLSQSCFQSAFITKSVLELSSLCELSGYWLLCNVRSPLFKITRQSIQNNWGSGMIGKDDLIFPSYYAFELLHRLGDKIIAQGHNYAAFQLSPHHFQVLAFHYAHLAQDAIYRMSEYNFSNVYDLFIPLPLIDISFHLTDLPSGMYQVSRTTLGREHGSILDLTINEYKESNLSASAFYEAGHFAYTSENQYRTRSCIPFEERLFIRIEDTLSMTAQLSPHTVILWDITKQL